MSLSILSSINRSIIFPPIQPITLPTILNDSALLIWYRFLSTDIYDQNKVYNWKGGLRSTTLYGVATVTLSTYTQSNIYKSIMGDDAATESKASFQVSTGVISFNITSSSGVTVAFWFYPIAGYTSSTGDWIFVFQSNYINFSIGVKANSLSNGPYNLFDYLNSSFDITSISINKWYHFAVVVETVSQGYTINYYLDGTKVAYKNITISFTSSVTTNRFSLGYALPGFVNSTPGYFQEFVFYNRKMTAAEITSLKNVT